MVKRVVSFSLDQPLFLALLTALFVFAALLRSLVAQKFPT
jgi:hypothetical protein